jgi:Xaa-Pro aminopeptidase
MSRIKKLFEKLNKQELDGFFFTDLNNIKYFSGFRGEGIFAAVKDKTYIITDFRYTEQAEAESPDSIVYQTGNQNFAEILGEIFNGVNKIGFEEDDITVSKLNLIKKHSSSVEFVGSTNFGKEIRIIKDDKEIELLKKAANATQDALMKAYSIAEIGMKEYEFAAEIEYFLRKKYNATPAFDFIVASGENGSMPHYITGGREFKEGEAVTFDFGARIDSYNSDMTRTFAMGKLEGKMAEIYKIVYEAQKTAQMALAPGKACKDIDKIARDIIDSYGYGQYFGHGLGHGVGLDIHELPFFNAKSEYILEEGMIITVEPGIYIPELGGVRIENTCRITKDGCEPLFDAATELNIIGGNL